jgi:hypothetical protein
MNVPPGSGQGMSAPLESYYLFASLGISRFNLRAQRMLRLDWNKSSTGLFSKGMKCRRKAQFPLAPILTIGIPMFSEYFAKSAALLPIIFAIDETEI